MAESVRDRELLKKGTSPPTPKIGRCLCTDQDHPYPPTPASMGDGFNCTANCGLLMTWNADIGFYLPDGSTYIVEDCVGEGTAIYDVRVVSTRKEVENYDPRDVVTFRVIPREGGQVDTTKAGDRDRVRRAAKEQYEDEDHLWHGIVPVAHMQFCNGEGLEEEDGILKRDRATERYCGCDWAKSRQRRPDLHGPVKVRKYMALADLISVHQGGEEAVKETILSASFEGAELQKRMFDRMNAELEEKEESEPAAKRQKVEEDVDEKSSEEEEAPTVRTEREGGNVVCYVVDKGKERKRRVVYPDGAIEHLCGDPGEEQVYEKLDASGERVYDVRWECAAEDNPLWVEAHEAAEIDMLLINEYFEELREAQCE